MQAAEWRSQRAAHAVYRRARAHGGAEGAGASGGKQALGAKVTGIARHAGERHGFPVVTVDDLPALLPRTDVLIMILPATPETAHALTAEVLALLPAHAWLVNVGRGSTVDEAALLAAIRGGRFGRRSARRLRNRAAAAGVGAVGRARHHHHAARGGRAADRRRRPDCRERGGVPARRTAARRRHPLKGCPPRW